MFFDIHTHKRQAEELAFSIVNLYPGKETLNTISAFSFFQNADNNTLHSPRQAFSIGMHPWNIPTNRDEALSIVHSCAISPNVLAIGETGIDKARGGDISIQREVFAEHVRISESVNKPLIIHCVKAFDELIAIRKALKPRQRWILHGFRGKPEQVSQLARLGFEFSFGEHFNSDAARTAFGLGKLWLETDESQLSIANIYGMAAEAIGCGTEELIHDIALRINTL